MARPFIITTAQGKIKLNEQGRGKVSFTVSNETGRPLKAQIKPKPLNAAKQEWLTVTGETERDFPAEGSQQVTVEVAIPAGTPEGKFDFRLDVASIYNPEDEYSEGPTVALEFSGVDGPEKKKFPWWIVAVGTAVLLIGVGALWFTMQPRKVVVPDVVGKSLSEATNALEAEKLEVGEERKLTREKLSGTVLEQDPAAGAEMEEGGTVTLIVEGEVPLASIPDVVGKLLSEAKSALEEKGFKVEADRKLTRGQAPGTVLSQNPTAGAELKEGGTVMLVVEAATPVVSVPNVVGKSKANAISAVEGANLKVKEETRLTRSKSPGTVLEQNPSGGLRIEEGETVTLVVEAATPIVSVPNVMGKSKSSAESTLKGKRLKVTSEERVLRAATPGTVVFQSPNSGTRLKEGETVTLVVEAATPVVSVPNVVGKSKSSARSTLEGKRFRVNVNENKVRHSKSEGTVLSQSPSSGTQLKEGQTVTLEASRKKNCEWTGWFSEENGGLKNCSSGYAVAGIRCGGGHCDNKQLYCCPYLTQSDNARKTSASREISEESGGGRHNNFSTSSGFLGGLKCKGSNCDNLIGQLFTSSNLKNVGECYDTSYFSEEGSAKGVCKEDWYVAGIACTGSYCDNLRLRCCKSQ